MTQSKEERGRGHEDAIAQGNLGLASWDWSFQTLLSSGELASLPLFQLKFHILRAFCTTLSEGNPCCPFSVMPHHRTGDFLLCTSDKLVTTLVCFPLRFHLITKMLAPWVQEPCPSCSLSPQWLAEYGGHSSHSLKIDLSRRGGNINQTSQGDATRWVPQQTPWNVPGTLSSDRTVTSHLPPCRGLSNADLLSRAGNAQPSPSPTETSCHSRYWPSIPPERCPCPHLHRVTPPPHLRVASPLFLRLIRLDPRPLLGKSLYNLISGETIGSGRADRCPPLTSWMSEAPRAPGPAPSKVSSLKSRWRASGFIEFAFMYVMHLTVAGGRLPGPIANLAHQQG